MLFAGRESALYKGKSKDVSALCSNGICTFFGILANLGSDQPHIDASSNIHVLPGRITHEQRSYAMLTDDRPEMGESLAVRELLNSLIAHVNEYGNSMTIDIKLFVRETYSGLKIWLEFEDPPTPSMGLISGDGPSKLLEGLLSQRGLIPCRDIPQSVHRQIWAAPVAKEAAEEAVKNGTWLKANGKTIKFSQPQHPTSLLAVYALACNMGPGPNQPEASIYVADNECLDCCLDSAQHDTENSLVFILRLP